jgi:hypothetical protein
MSDRYRSCGRAFYKQGIAYTKTLSRQSLGFLRKKLDTLPLVDHVRSRNPQNEGQ